jgi:hypothetical protein
MSKEERSISSSVLYLAFGVRGLRYVKTVWGGRDDLHHGAATNFLPLPGMRLGGRDRSGQTPRRFRAVSMGSTPVHLALAVPLVESRDCGVARQVAIPDTRPLPHCQLPRTSMSKSTLSH